MVGAHRPSRKSAKRGLTLSGSGHQLQSTLTAHASNHPLTLYGGHAAPDPVALSVRNRMFEARVRNRAFPAHCFGRGDLFVVCRKEDAGIESSTSCVSFP